MIDPQSPLRRVPPLADPRQAIILDGLRHAAEVVGLCDIRMRITLAEIAVARNGPPAAHAVTSVLADAWSIVDAIDRFAALIQLLPARDQDAAKSISNYVSSVRPIRALRNVTDHLAQRVPYLVAHRMPAMGRLRWFTPTSDVGGTSCLLVPGTVRPANSIPMINPLNREIRMPAGLVVLEAGEHEASLCDAIQATEGVVRQLEKAIATLASEQQLENSTAGADLLIAMDLNFGPQDPVNEGGLLPRPAP